MPTHVGSTLFGTVFHLRPPDLFLLQQNPGDPTSLLRSAGLLANFFDDFCDGLFDVFKELGLTDLFLRDRDGVVGCRCQTLLPNGLG